MSNLTTIPFAIAPGETLKETIDALGMTQMELSQRTGLSTKTINLIIKGKEPVSLETALELEKVLKVPAHFWLTMESRYREVIAREKEAETMGDYAEWARCFPYAEMAKRGFVKTTRKADEKASALLNFFAVKNPEKWKEVYDLRDLNLSYRKSPKASEKHCALAAWLRVGENEAEKTEVPDFCAEIFRGNLDEIRGLTSREPNDFVVSIRELCAKAGVIYVLVPELPGLGISGVMRWYRGRPLIQQSLLFKTNDSFWFTFFHEAKHVLQAKKKDIFVEGQFADRTDLKREEEADRFAREILIPQAEWESFLREHGKPTSAAIRRFANEQKIHAGIVVGRLFREKILDYGHPALKLQARFQWSH